MKIKTLQLKNFRAFKDLELFPNGKSMIIFGKNGTGKSSILRAIRYLVAYIELNWNKTKGAKRNRFVLNEEDLNNEGSNAVISSVFDTLDLPIMLTYPEEVFAIANNQKTIDIFRKDYKDRIENEVFIYYGIDRYIYSNYVDLKVNSKNIGKSIDKMGLTSIVDFSSFIYWYRETQENHYKSLQENIRNVDSDTNAKNYEIIQEVVSKVLDGCMEVSYSIDNGNIDLIFTYKNGKKLKYEQLSDGEKTMVSLFMDITMRLCENNKYVNLPLNCDGIVVIDEIEQHLHLSWQRTILKKLKLVFPKIQFIITTHSPIVLSETGNDYYLIGLKKKNDKIIAENINAVCGYDIGYIIAKFFETSTDSEEVTLIKNELDKCMKSGDIDGAKKVVAKWEDISGNDNVDIELAKFDIERGKK